MRAELSLFRGTVPGTIDENAVAEVWNGLIAVCTAGCNAASDAIVVVRPAGLVPILPLSGPLNGAPRLACALTPLPGLASVTTTSL